MSRIEEPSDDSSGTVDMGLLGDARLQRQASALVLVIAAAAMVATSKDSNETTARASGSFELGSNVTTRRLTLTIAANERLIEETPSPEPWSARFEYSLRTTAATRPDVRARIIPLPDNEGARGEPYVEPYLPTHPVPCQEDAACERRYLVVFTKRQPRAEPVTVEWAAEATVDWGEADVPGGVDLEIRAVGADDESEIGETTDEDAPVEGIGTELHATSFQTPVVFPLRFEKPAGEATGPREIKLVSTAVGGQTARGRLRLIPEDPQDPETRVGIGQTTYFDPFQRCRTEEGCVVGYTLQLGVERGQTNADLETEVAITSSSDAIELLRGGVELESTSAQIDARLRRTMDFPVSFNYEVFVEHVDRVPPGTEMEVEALIEARLQPGAQRRSVQSLLEFGQMELAPQLNLTPKDPRDSATSVLLLRCTHPCEKYGDPDLNLGSVGGWFYPEHLKDASVRYVLTTRLRFPELARPPKGVDLEIETIYEHP